MSKLQLRKTVLPAAQLVFGLVSLMAWSIPLNYLDFSVLPPLWHWVLAMILAALVGSFLTVATTRLPRRFRGGTDGPTTLGGRSYCPHCRMMIPLYRNIPILTWLLQYGRTACCSKAIPWRYFLLEVGCAAMAAAVIGVFGFSFTALGVFLTGALLMSVIASS